MEKIMKLFNKIIIIPTLLFGALLANDAKNGEDLYHFSDCTSCHNSANFNEKNRKAKNFKELHKSVEACRYSTGADWFDEDRDDVVHYLNQKYYNYEKK
jgi:cytochrome c2